MPQIESLITQTEKHHSLFEECVRKLAYLFVPHSRTVRASFRSPLKADPRRSPPATRPPSMPSFRAPPEPRK